MINKTKEAPGVVIMYGCLRPRAKDRSWNARAYRGVSERMGQERKRKGRG